MPAATMTSHMIDSVSDAGSAVMETLHTGRLSAADALHSAAKNSHAKADRAGRAGHDAADTVSRVGNDAADKVEAASVYVRSHNARRMLSDIENFVRKNPGKSLLAVAVVGFFAGSVLRRRH